MGRTHFEVMLLVRTYLDRSKIHGVGVFAAEEIDAESLVWEFHPIIDRLISVAEFEMLPLVAKEMVRRHAEFVTAGNFFVLSGDNDRYMNHSENPNIREAGRRMYSNRRIRTNEEMTCDYRQVRVLEFAPVEDAT